MKNWKWPNFAPEEVLSPEGLEQLDRGILLVQPELLGMLESFRAFLGYPLLINHMNLRYRGYRSPRENYDIVHGEKYSFHMQGLAADISVPQLPLEQLRDNAVKFGWHAVGYYPKKNFIHCDLRPRIDNSYTVQWVGT